MRILLASQPVRSHLHSLMPLALAAQRLGHTVAVASGARTEPFVRRLGLDFLPCGVDYDWTLNPVTQTPGYSPPPDAPLVVQQLLGFTFLAPHFARDLLAHLPAWRPDVIVREPVEFGAALAAARHGIPCASIMWALYINPRFLMNEAYAAIASAFGLDGAAFVESLDRDLVIKVLPPGWQMPMPPDPPAAASFCAPPFDGGQEETTPVWRGPRDASRPTLYVTLGLSFSRAPALFRVILDAVDGLPINVILTTGTELDPAALGALPANVLAARYIPAGQLLPHCRAVLFHGGFNTLHGALWHGLPLVVTPLEAGDHAPTAEHVEALGLGLRLSAPLPGVDETRAAIVRVLHEPGFAAVARTLQAQMHAAPPLDDAIARLGALATQ